MYPQTEKIALAIWATDIHLSDKTIEVTSGIFDQLIENAVKNGRQIFLGGDIFTERKNQSLNVLMAFWSFLKKCKEAKVSVIAIAGNHDKTDYFSKDSFLRFFDGNTLKLISDYGKIELATGITAHFVPYFDEEIYANYLDKAVQETKGRTGQKHYLFTHIAVNGVKNNERAKPQKGIGTEGFRAFDKVFVGHYHNHQEFANIIYTGSTHPANFGEDSSHKGIYIFFDDGSFQHQPLRYKKYVTGTIPPTLSLQEVNKLISGIQNSKNHVRIVIEKDSSTECIQLKKKLEGAGAKVDIKNNDLIANTKGGEDIVANLTDNDLVDKYDEWGKRKNPSHFNFGKKVLNEKINKTKNQ